MNIVDRIRYHGLPKWMRDSTFLELHLTTRESDLKEKPPCPICETPMRTCITNYACGERSLVIAAKGPGFRCARDGVVIQSEMTLLEFFPRARDKFIKRGHTQYAHHVKASYELELRNFTNERTTL